MVQLEHPRIEDVSVAEVLAVLGNPIRLDIVRRLTAGEELTCSSAVPGMAKSTASHHWRVMREGGVLRQTRDGKYIRMSLRAQELNKRFPGLLTAVLQAESS
jgi:DNA-binding transcriptional ArsR family regulator